MRVTYEEVKQSASLNGVCRICKKKMVKKRTFGHTINPFNRNDDGTIRNHQQVYERVKAEANEWQPDFIHDKCK